MRVKARDLMFGDKIGSGEIVISCRLVDKRLVQTTDTRPINKVCELVLEKNGKNGQTRRTAYWRPDTLIGTERSSV